MMNMMHQIIRTNALHVEVKIGKLDYEMERHIPIHPLPLELSNAPRDETVCQYCGVSYLIHHEMKLLEDKVEELERKLAEYTDKASNYNHLENMFQDMKQRHAQEVNKFSEEHTKLSLLLDQNIRNFKAERNSNETLQKELKKLENTNQKLSDNLLETKQEVDSLHVHLEEKDRNISMLQFQLRDFNRLNVLHGKLQDDHEKLKEKTEKQQKCNNSLSTHNKQNSEQILSLQEQISMLKNTNEAITKELADAEVEITHLNEVKSETNNQLDEASRNLNSFKTKTSYLITVNGKLKNQADRFQSENKMLNVKIERLQVEKQDLKSLLEKEEEENLEFKERNSNLQEACHELQTSRDKLSLQNKQLIIEVQTCKSERDKFRADLNSVMQKMEALNKDCKKHLDDSYKEHISETAMLKKELEELKISLQNQHQEFLNKLKQREEQLKLKHVTELDIVREQFRESLLQEEENKYRLNQAWEEKWEEYRREMKKNLLKLESQTQKDQEEPSYKTEMLERENQSLKAIIQKQEIELSKRSERSDDKALENNYNKLIIDYEDKNKECILLTDELITKSEEIEYLQETVKKECDERNELIKKLQIFQMTQTKSKEALFEDLKDEEIARDADVKCSSDGNNCPYPAVFKPLIDACDSSSCNSVSSKSMLTQSTRSNLSNIMTTKSNPQLQSVEFTVGKGKNQNYKKRIKKISRNNGVWK